MHDKIVRLCYRKIIDTEAKKAWEQYVFEDTYKELSMQSQMYNADKRYNLYSELVNNVVDADKLPFLVSATVVGYLKQLNGVVPDVTNLLGRLFLLFKNYKFEIIESSIINKALHKVAIGFISEPVTWHGTIGDALLLSVFNQRDSNDGAQLTEMVKLQPYLSIFSLQNKVV